VYAFDYRAGDEDGYADGAVFIAEIRELAPMPDSEMAEVRCFERIPTEEQLTYPGITPVLFQYAIKNNLFH
jgi:hypothetical protein